ncbi:Bifunctional oligoribonuclease and PAP phosphatase NrnA [Jeotgalicoccus aerolatus]|uniref:Phosphoesterase RecJ domain-containing protein n=1 Tax=Jeotgalicoccus aerolatus TaxID=709510 RepID=A0A1G8VFJ8_9STAP|nr:bifunctional oligoribonuclease/PAP phosphatase NrnA [Jeotgalicoccus aerolatus]MBP1952520.1 phosphoesterase RecJ-like protein [Jeotgalicoccus aerolatus]NMA82089.1 bifunctional oligoribonuclease/PAP phosphatase NrnA [Jeotgalicoccus aerolatus]CAD2074668.1 Bifunctional oligoribonuclease and PAP phosphatase NrnA [Jeotgalicoccus aerolatus]SDJ64687.1 phosphoesterase RecJ domain-containing protein [Jeotgalicoccus aerolatus]GGD93048.1 oligoribonuclease [Jeotgalicoccus aerolatus]
MFNELTGHLNDIKTHTKDVLDLIERHDEIVILRHQKPDPDAYGAQLGLRAYLRNKYPDKSIQALGEGEPSLSFLGDMDRVTTIESPLVIVVDTANTDRIDGSLDYAKKVVKIDHHPNVELYGDVSIVETEVSSASELIYLLIQKWDKNSMTDEAAALFYMGIVGDTGRFLYNNTTQLTHAVASKLKEFNFDAAGMNNLMHQSSIEKFKYKGYLIHNAVFTNSGIAYVYVPKSVMAEYGLSVSEAGLDVNIFREIDEVKVWFIALEGDGEIRVRLRSKEVVINDVAAVFDGGGHPLASGVRVKDLDVLDELIAKIEEKL